MKMFEMLPKDGLTFKYFDTEKPNSLAILPGWEATDIMLALNRKYENPHKKDFDAEISLLFQKGTDYLKYRVSPEGLARFPGEIPSAACFWSVPKQETMFRDVHVATVYRFALKVMEARKVWIEAHDSEQILAQAPYHCDTARAVDRFDNLILSVGAFRNEIASNLTTLMTADSADQIGEDDIPGQVRLQVDAEDYSLFTIEEICTLQSSNDVGSVEDGSIEQVDGAENGQDDDMTDAGTDAYDAYLQKMQELDLENAENEEMMDIE
ncbi:hypothetical protein SLS53_006211 [Cytospora paraplurivora]|uniref:Uncharacterized protein n=1 Tax=Cytospora paraplurivora TaxID=2898453 RepID=A0AAN9U5J3_9PEZI